MHSHILIICFFATFLSNGSTELFGEDTDLNILNYEIVDDLNDQSELWHDDRPTLTIEEHRKLCEIQASSELIEDNQFTIDCSTFALNNPRIKRDAAVEEEGSGDGDGKIIEDKEEIVSTETAIVTEKKEEEPPVETDEKQDQSNVEKEDEENKEETSSQESKSVETISQRENHELDKDEIKEVPKLDDPKKDAEVMKGRTLLTPDKNMEHTHDEADEKPKLGGSTQSAGSKDTTILIVLFVGVVIVGVAAFGYNYIKKRKQQSADLEIVEKSTVEEKQRPEKEPLMEEENEVEMTDMKQNGGSASKEARASYHEVPSENKS